MLPLGAIENTFERASEEGAMQFDIERPSRGVETALPPSLPRDVRAATAAMLDPPQSASIPSNGRQAVQSYAAHSRPRPEYVACSHKETFFVFHALVYSRRREVPFAAHIEFPCILDH